MIEAAGPLSVAEYMTFCLTHPRHGYYVTRDPLGAAGDFTTAPEISQMFGEVIGLWAAQVWLDGGGSPPLRLAELGPGRGTLMADALRAIGQVPALKAARPQAHLVEISPALRQRQREALAGRAADIVWHDDIATLPRASTIVIANEFFDALPIRQAVYAEGGWHERRIGLDANGALSFGLAPHRLANFSPPVAPPIAPGAVFEWRDSRIATELAGRIARHGGALLAIDYGHARSGYGETLQAVRRHAFEDVLASPGEADLTAHVDFAVMAAAAAHAGARVFGPTGQGAFLTAVGIVQRAERLAAAAPGKVAEIEAALARLTGTGEGRMGALFKVIGIAPAGVTLPGFDR